MKAWSASWRRFDTIGATSTCIEGPRMLPVGTVSALELAQHWGSEWHAWWIYARHALAVLPEDVRNRAACEPIGECTADEVIGESIALERNR